MRVALVERRTSKTEREVWEFSVLRYPDVHLEFYGKQSRKTPRHGWKSTTSYHRLHIDRNANVGTRLKEEPEVPEDVLAEALEQVRSKITFKPWKKR